QPGFRPVPAPVLRPEHAPARRRGNGPGQPRPPGSARLPQLRDRLAEPDVERTNDHAPFGQPGWRLHLDRRGGGRVPVQHGAGDRGDAHERRPRVLAGVEGRGEPDRGGPPGGRADGTGVWAVPDAGGLRREEGARTEVILRPPIATFWRPDK